MEAIEATINRIRNLPQYRNKTEEELRILAEILLEKKRKKKEEAKLPKPVSEPSSPIIDVDSLFDNDEEKKLARGLLKKYLLEFELENISDKALLKELIYLEVFQRTRLQKSAEEIQKEAGAVPLQILDSIHKNIDKIVYLKQSLGLTKEKNQEQSDAYKSLMTMMKKAEVWRKENQASRTLYCPHCVKPILMKIRTEAWEAQKHPFFKDRVLYNKKLVELYLAGRITQEEFGEILQVSPDYITWLVEKYHHRAQVEK